jgi:hypothetical protein
MTLSGYLSEFSLGEIFQLIEQGEKTGLLSIRELTLTNNLLSEESLRHRNKYYFWFRKGRVIAANHDLNETGLQTLIQQRGWLENEMDNSHAQYCDRNSPLGRCLHSLGIINRDQLRILFLSQVMREVCFLFKLDQGFFMFETNRKPPVVEMTGLSKPATELALIGLRRLKNWTPLAEKLPQPTSGLVSLINAQPSYYLRPEEQQVWEYTQQRVAINTIAQELQLSLQKVQQIAFCFIVIGLAEELPMVEMLPPEAAPSQLEQESETTSTVSDSFLNNLTSFLQTKISS